MSAFFTLDTTQNCDLCHSFKSPVSLSALYGIPDASSDHQHMLHTFPDCKHKICKTCVKESVNTDHIIEVNGMPCIPIKCQKCLNAVYQAEMYAKMDKIPKGDCECPPEEEKPEAMKRNESAMYGDGLFRAFNIDRISQGLTGFPNLVRCKTCQKLKKAN